MAAILTNPQIVGLYLGEDLVLEVHVLTRDKARSFNVSGMTFRWTLRSTASSAITLIEKTTEIEIEGTFNADKTLNTQRIVIPIAAEDTEGLTAGTYDHELRRNDDGAKTVMARGRFPLMASHRG